MTDATGDSLQERMMEGARSAPASPADAAWFEDLRSRIQSESRMQDTEADGIPGDCEHVMQSLERARAGETVTLDELAADDEAAALLDEDGRRERLHAAMSELHAREG